MNNQEEQFNIFLESLLKATEKIPEGYFMIPVASKEEAIYRERSYCYELYHNIKLELPNDFNFTLSGELDKKGHPIISQKCGEIIPDFLVHRPGKMGLEDNFVIIEVKSIKNTDDNEISKDFRKLKCMTEIENGYYRGIHLIYGYDDSESGIKIKEIYKKKCNTEKVLLIFHNKPCTKAEVCAPNMPI
ncbi:MAG: hypothetical protein KIT33_05110 [Candidatus Kapabacteria bacterium]|nr:hypothetical protein [Ignavibacteriota bacterium]MCW5884335.1 hypothetical protein [Candidatus Kapabacteria bacterium]